MVKKFILFLLFPLSLFSAEFTASISRNKVNLGESLILNLTLKEAAVKEIPLTNDLKSHFTIGSQQQFSNTSIINGKVTSSVSWKITLLPKNEGEITIPPISVITSEGVLTSLPITLQVVKPTLASTSESYEEKMLKITTSVSNETPYKNEPFIYTVKLTTKKDLANIKLEKIEVEDAIVEANGEPKIYETIASGLNVGVVEFSYLITPLKAGSLKIPPTVVQGVIPTRRMLSRDSFFDEDFNPFAMMGGLDQLKPFSLMTEESVLQVQPSVAAVNPWLPAKSLKIEEIWDKSEQLKVGEPLNRGFKIVAEGVSSNLLPNLNDLQIRDNAFKAYADKPELGDEIKDATVKSYRNEQYTLIPQQAGTLVLPEISIAWWNTEKKEKAYTRIPSRTLQILPASESVVKNSPVTQNDAPLITAQLPANSSQDSLLYSVIIGLVALLMGSFAWIIIIQRKIARLTKQKTHVRRAVPIDNSKYADPKKSKQEKLPDLNPS